MRPLTDAERRDWRVLQVIAFAIGIAAPIIYLIIAQVATVTARPQAGMDMIYYILLILGAFQPAVAPIINRAQVNQYLRARTRPSPGKFFINITIIRIALVEAIFVYGMMIYFMSGDFNRMLYFYPLGAVWMFVYWPRKGKYETFIEQVERSAGRP